MSDRLLTLQEAADYLNLTEEEVRELVSEGSLPAYQVGGMYLRFKEENVSALKAGLSSDHAAGRASAAQDKARHAGYKHKAASRLKDFLYFNDFYIIAIGLILLLLYVIIKVIH